MKTRSTNFSMTQIVILVIALVIGVYICAKAQMVLSGQNNLGGYTTMNVNPLGAVVKITSGNPPNCTNGCVYSFQVTATGGRTPYAFSAVGLPTGLTINGTTGLITGNPSVNSTFNGTINVQDFNGIMAQPLNFTIVISAGAPALKITSGSLTSIVGTVGQVFPTYTGTASGGTQPYVWSINTGALPGGLSLVNSANTGIISGTYITAGSFSGNLRVTDNVAAFVDLPFSFTVNPTPPPCNVTVSPLSATVQLGQTQQFTATVTNCNPSTVTWQVNGVTGGLGPNGTVTNQGLYTAPVTAPNPPTATVTAVSVADNTKSGSGSINLLSPTSGNGNIYCAPGDVPQFPTPEGTVTIPATCFNTALASTPTKTNPTIRTFTDQTTFVAAYNASACGDIVQAAAGTRLVGNTIVLAGKVCPTNTYIWIRTADFNSLPPEQNRITPCYAGISSLPGYVDDSGNSIFSCSNTTDHMVHFTVNTANPVIQYTGTVQSLRWIGIDFGTSAGTGVVTRVIDNSMSTGNHIVYDRCLIHGTPTTEVTRSMNFDNYNDIAIIDSFLYDFICGANTGQCTDAQGITGGINTNNLANDHAWKAVNDFVAAAAENIEFGGGAASIIPADIEIRNNFLYKPPAWNQSSPFYNGGIIPFGKTTATPQQVKNLLECKNCQTMWAEGNVMWNTWGGFSQVGPAILMTPKNQQNGTQNQCPICATLNIVIRYNFIHSVGQVFQIGNSVNGNGAYAFAGNRYSVYDNIADNIGYSTFNSCQPADAIQGVTGATAPASDIMHDVYYNDNSFIFAQTACSSALWPLAGFNIDGPTPAVQSNLTFTNLLSSGGQFGVNSAFSGTGHCNTGLNSNTFKPMFDACWTSYLFDGNMIEAGNPAGKSPPWTWPGTHNVFPIDWPAVGFVNYNAGSNGDYHLSNTSPGKGAGVNPVTGIPDGHDIGAHVDLVNQFTSNVTSMFGGGTSPVGFSPSACAGVNNPTTGCVALFPGFTDNSHTGNGTPLFDPSPNNISTLPMSKWLYTGNTTLFIGEYQPWFCPTGFPANCNGHKNIAMDEHNTAQLTSQLQAMAAHGINAISVDWYGTTGGQIFNDTTTVDIGNIIASGIVPMQLIIVYDQGSFVAGCPQGAADETACISAQMIADLDVANSRWFQQSWYTNDANRPLLLYFITESLWTGTNWTTVWTNVTNHIAGYAKKPKQIFRAGSFAHVNEDGEYAWPQPAGTYSTTNQFFWGDNSSTTPNYIDNFLANCLSHSTEVCIPYMAKGFNDLVASWGTGRVTDQQAGNVLFLTGNEITHNNSFGTSNQLKYMQIATMNDYEEGTEIETGVDNTYAVTATLVGASTLNWTTTSGNSKANLRTIAFDQIYYLDALGHYILVKDQLPNNSTTIDLSTLSIPVGQWQVFVVAEGMPYEWNKISNAVTYIH